MRIRAIYKAGKEFKDFHYNIKHAFEDKEHFAELKISEEEKNREIDEYNKSKQFYLNENLCVGILAEDAPDLNFRKEDIVLFSNSFFTEKQCLIVCQYKKEYLLAHYFENEDNENIFKIVPLSEKYPTLTNDNNEDLKILGKVHQLHRLSQDWKEPFNENIEEKIV